MNNLKLEIKDLTKFFTNKLIFRKINFSVESGSSVVITGKNGSGKSTLLKIISGIISKSSGERNLFLNGEKIKEEDYYQYLGYISPYLILYDEFTLIENLTFAANIRGIKLDKEITEQNIETFGLTKRKNDLIKTYSSGMKQRAKYLFALVHNPLLICIDEPTSNLDEEGKNKVYDLINELRKDRIVILATNEKNEIEFGNKVISLDDYKN